MSSPMDPSDLAALRMQAGAIPGEFLRGLVSDLLEAHDHHERMAGEYKRETVELRDQLRLAVTVRNDATRECERLANVAVELESCEALLRSYGAEVEVARSAKLHPDSFRTRMRNAESDRDLYRTKLRELMGAGFDEWLADNPDSIPF